MSCYITHKLCYITRDMLCYITHMLYYITHDMLCYITYDMLCDVMTSKLYFISMEL